MPDNSEPQKPFKENVKDFLFKNIRYGIGCAWIGRDYEDRQQVKRDLEMLETSYRLGFRYYDTSAAYGMSEKVVGEFVAVIPRESIFLATKSRLPEPGNPKAAVDAMRRSLEESLRRLHTDRLDLFQIHDVDTLTDVLAADGVLELLVNLRQQGTIRYFGLATRWHNLLEQAAKNGAFDTILRCQP